MRALILLLLLTVSAPTEQADDRRPEARTGLEAPHPLPPEMATVDPCALGRELGRQPPCLARGDCRALELWRRAFGAPRIEPLRPGRLPGVTLALPRPRGPAPGHPPGRPPRVQLPRSPFAVCPAGEPGR